MGREKFDLKHSQSVSYSSRVTLLWIFFFKECDSRNCFVLVKCKNYLEKRLPRISLHVLSSSLKVPRRARLVH